MIDLGLAKLALVGAVALIVIGPEKLPKVARMAGSLFGRAQRYLNQVKAEVSREIELDEMRKMQQGVQEATTELKSMMNKEWSDVEQSVDPMRQDFKIETQRLPELSRLSYKAREFRRKKLVRHSALPAWYKKHQGCKINLLSASARVAKYRPRTQSSPFPKSFF